MVCNNSLVLYVDDQQYDYSYNVFIVTIITSIVQIIRVTTLIICTT